MILSNASRLIESAIVCSGNGSTDDIIELNWVFEYNNIAALFAIKRVSSAGGFSRCQSIRSTILSACCSAIAPVLVTRRNSRSWVSRKIFIFCCYCKQHFLYFLPLPHGQGSFLPAADNELTGTLLSIIVCSSYKILANKPPSSINESNTS